MSIREAAVAGLFYEADPARLKAQLAGFLSSSLAQAVARPKVLIVPHAGYVYSGSTAAAAYRLLEPLRDEIRRVVLLGPAHRVYLQGMALPSVDAFETPLGEVPLERAALDAISTMPGVCISDEAHREEHSLEVQLPFLQTLLTSFSLLPVLVGDCDPNRVGAVLDELWGGPETLVVISSDLSHFHAYEEACEIDASTCARILQKSTGLSGEEACGARALNGLMSARHCRELNVDLLAACNSGDTAGDRGRVVGYGAFQLS